MKNLLKNYTTLRIGGPAKEFFSFENKQELLQRIEEVGESSFFVLGGGSNVLFSDKGYQGVILKNEMRKVKTKNETKVFSESGASLAKVLSFCLSHGLSGLEWSAGIPGTIGGAVRGNAGAFGKSMQDSVVSVTAYDVQKKKEINLKNKECFFDYRESVFKKKKSLIILSVEMNFKKKDVKEINEKIKEVLSSRKKKQPQGFSAGSVFKNYLIKNEKEKKEIMTRNPEIIIKDNYVPAAFLIEKAGLKGKTINKAMFSRVHANFIINLGQAKSKDVSALISMAEKKVKEKFNINLEKEIVVETE
jgi:UDP-N-acetylmuramate dehydrogenase